MTDNVIKLNKSNILKLRIQDDEGNETGETLQFDLEDIELPLRYQELVEKDKKNREYLSNEITIIRKRQDVKGKKILTKNQEDEIKAVNDFFKKEIDVYNMFLGENGVQKLLNGRKIGWTTLAEIDEIIEKQIIPYFDMTINDINEKIKQKYGKVNDKEVLK